MRAPDTLADRAIAVLVRARKPLTAEVIANRLGDFPGIEQSDLAESVTFALERAFRETRVTRRTVGGEIDERQVLWSTRPTSAPEPPAAPEPEAPARRPGFLSVFRPKAPPAPPAPRPLTADELLEELMGACIAADLAAHALGEALQRRHAALVRLSSSFPAGSGPKAVVNRSIGASAVHRALCVAPGLARFIGLPQVAHAHRSSFRDQVTSLPSAPAAPGHIEETEHVEAV